MNRKKLLLIGWDAADWKIIGSLLKSGHMPALKSLIDRGVYGNMSTLNPPYSPMLWSTVATGKTPDKHGVLGFVEVMPDMSGVRSVTTNSRKSRAVWNILHNQGFTSNVVGWWPSYPAEPINGVVVSDKFQKVSADPKKQTPIEPSTIHPQNMKDELKDLRMFPFEITKEHILPFFPLANKIDQEKDKGLKSFSKIMASNVSVHNAVTKLLRTTDWDFTAVYYDLIDHFCHSYMKFHPPKLDGITSELFEIYKDAIYGAYRFQDMMLARKLELIDADTTVIVMSDHGFESGYKRILNMPSVQAAPALEHRQFGIFVAAGPGIKKNEKVFGLGLVDIAPTILHHFGLAIGKDMDGKVLSEIYKDRITPTFVDSWDKLKGDFGEIEKEEGSSVLSDSEAMQQLIELGYIDSLDEDKEKAIFKTQSDLKHNLARVYLGQRNFIEAKKILNDLMNEDKLEEKGPVLMDLISLSIKSNEFLDAKRYLEDLKKSKTKVRYNLFFPESDILLGLGQPLKALNILESQKSKRNSGELWFRIGRLHYGLRNYDQSKEAFSRAIEIEPDKAQYHRGLAETLFMLKDYESAVDHSLTSIELVKNFPSAHYILGRSLEKLGDIENARLAFQTAVRIKSDISEKAKRAIENIEDKRNISLKLSNKTTNKFIENQIVIVSGLPRSGTSLMMQMLESGGLDILTDNKREADISNPKGYYEFEPVMSIHKDNSWLATAKSKTVKVVAPLLKYLDPKYRYKVIFMKRDINEVIQSQRKMVGKNIDTVPLKLFNAFHNQLESIDIWKDTEPGVELIYVDYKSLVDSPEEAIKQVENFVGINLDKSQMITRVDKSLYRNKPQQSSVD
ncbi:hypothetical protein GCM10009117_24500 [Gangjinia marincola]|uniref:Sulfotransferase domain-containing protein n=1 Tax=Gangjinia marincola TaxID=578463 RepID=A0ABN1MJM6_9FLAO